MFERYTENARRVIFHARYEASQFGSPYIETEHLLLGAIRDKSLVHQLFRKQPAAIAEIRNKIESVTVVRERISTSVDLPLSNECMRILAYAAEEAERAADRHIGTEHLLAGMLREEGCFAANLLQEAGMKLDDVRAHIKSAGRQEPPAEPKPSGSLADRARVGHGEDCVEIISGSARVGITALPVTTHIPRIGDEVIINDPDVGLRSFRVKDVTFYYDTEPPSRGAPQRLSKIMIHVENSGVSSDTAFSDIT